jgi:hypothetical protein
VPIPDSRSKRPFHSITRSALASTVVGIVRLSADPQGTFCILVDREHDRLHMVEAVAFTRTHVSYIGERLRL